jgi:hypothetical protein
VKRMRKLVGAVGVEPTTARDLKANIASKLESVDIDLPFVIPVPP